MIEKARQFAIEHHGNQKYGDQPYVVHLDEVAEIAADFGEDAIVIAYLHDVVEDTQATLDDIECLFGRFISDCVAIVTDETGRNRAERKPKTYRKMSQVSGELELALIVKAADRLANLRTCVAQDNHRLFKIYKNEHPTFRRSAYRANLCNELWIEIENLIQAHHPEREGQAS